VIKRRLDGLGNPKGVKVKGEWFDISGHRVFRSRGSRVDSRCRNRICP
jgi:hypothetical protein